MSLESEVVVATLGRGFEGGIVLITLNADGTKAWHEYVATRRQD